MLGAALAFSFAAEATNYNSTVTAAPAAVATQENMLQQWQKKLLGPYANIDTLTSGNIREAYITFMSSVREQHSSWSDKEWEQAKAVLDKLDYKKNTLEGQLGLADKAKIKALQAEFRTLETAGDVKN